MKRICIYVTYDPENIADNYIGGLLHELRKAVACLVVVCNYEYILAGIENIQPYADKIYYRSNMGFDAGAYKDAICNYIGWNEIDRYDELLLINDSFYGPLHPFENMFHVMEKVNTDYWGMTRSPAGKSGNGDIYNEHVQSYFIAFRKKILQSNGFRQFWTKMEYPKSYVQAVASFELSINNYLEGRGFIGTAFMDICPFQCTVMENENPYMLYPLELIRDAEIPVFKRKSLSIGNKGFKNALDALRFIENERFYDVNLIINHLMRINKLTKDREVINFSALDKFYIEHSRIFFYGAGLCAKNLAEYFKYRGWIFESFLVTNVENQSENCTAFEEAEISGTDGIIIAVLDETAVLEILEIVRNRLNKSQIFCLDKDI